ncbi:putative cardiolipin synthase [Hasllibacter halocynthiae]|uniref:Phospholipase D n=1 Tax=Hasllibacter halocynthiae TaxID=595589 RepID=A0A2T0XA15_9RHOB|nr:phospholipase D family protein [Hasllibacter halocynthiae]PRY95762.1 putative cardiolipin synthase [Hasllibacter halocynthiae]
MQESVRYPRAGAALRRVAIGMGIGGGALLAARLAFPPPTSRGPVQHALPPARHGPLADGIQERSVRHEGLTGVASLRDGVPAFAARALLADVAVRSIDAQYYIWKPDLTGLLLLDALWRAAERGVRVRLLLDDNGTDGLDPYLAWVGRHPRIEVRLYNPFNLRRGKRLAYAFDFPRLNRRMHNKSFTVDGRATIVGGRNIGDEYFDTGAQAIYLDRDVLAVGPVVEKVSADFDRYWNCPSVHPAAPILGPPPARDPLAPALREHLAERQWATYREELQDSRFVERIRSGEMDLEWTRASLLSDDPAKGEGRARPDQLLAERLARAVGGVAEGLDGVSPYFVPGCRGTELFALMARRGVQVRLLTNALEATDVLPVHAGYVCWRRALLTGGVRLFELKREAAPPRRTKGLGPFGSAGSSLHAKTFAVDGERVYVGSFNFDPRSTSLNTEMGLLIESPRMAAEMRAAFDEDLHGLAWEVLLRGGHLLWRDTATGAIRPDEPGGTPSRALAIAAMKHLPIEWLL